MKTPLVLVVDDEPGVLQALGRALQGQGYEVLLMGDPHEACRRLRQGDVDLLLADFKMPGLEGTGVLALAAEVSPRTIRGVLTGYPGESLPTPVAPLAAFVLQKPWDNASLRATLREALAGKGD